jgi:hypothetical protein
VNRNIPRKRSMKSMRAAASDGHAPKIPEIAVEF